MSNTLITIRIPKELRERMRKIDINWSEEIRRFIEYRVKAYELANVIEDIRKRAKGRRVKIDSWKLIREDRESR